MSTLFVHSVVPAATTEKFVVNPATGVALYGFDPVSYFTKYDAVQGSEQYEVYWQGTYWHFSNAANADRFREAPTVYVPSFNGYGAYAISTGQLAEGNPLIWAIFENRLFFFHSAEARGNWAKNPVGYVEVGRKQWNSLEKLLSE